MKRDGRTDLWATHFNIKKIGFVFQGVCRCLQFSVCGFPLCRTTVFCLQLYVFCWVFSECRQLPLLLFGDMAKSRVRRSTANCKQKTANRKPLTENRKRKTENR